MQKSWASIAFFYIKFSYLDFSWRIQIIYGWYSSGYPFGIPLKKQLIEESVIVLFQAVEELDINKSRFSKSLTKNWVKHMTSEMLHGERCRHWREVIFLSLFGALSESQIFLYFPLCVCNVLHNK